MGGVPTPVGRKVAPGEMIDLYVKLRAPQVYGTFQGFWQLVRPTARPRIVRLPTGCTSTVSMPTPALVRSRKQ